MPAPMKHFRIELHTLDPAAYERVLTIAQTIKDDMLKNTAGYGYHVEACQYDDKFDYPIDL